ncbi:MAG: hypothetical protein HWE25_07265 [Alphaproteobacteria bacterium]|nr:hypothetical protein [Alphaproteobacteria bacterium]
MILRRFMKHVSDQNWFAVGLDVLVVISGIFIGLQVTDWNQARKDAAEGLYYLEFMRDQLREEVGERAAEITDSDEKVRASAQALSLLYKESWTEEDRTAFDQAHRNIYSFWGPRHRPAALRRLVEGGKLDLIASREIQNAILQYESAYMEAIQQTETSYSYAQDITMGFTFQYRFRELVSTNEELLGNRQLQTAFRGKFVMQSIQLDVLKTIQTASEELLATLDAHLGRKQETP